MEGLGESKLGEGQQWGANASSRDKAKWGRRPPFIDPHESDRYVQNRVGPVLPPSPPVVPVSAGIHSRGTWAVLPVEQPVVPVFRGRPELPLHHRPTTGSYTEVYTPRGGSSRGGKAGTSAGPDVPGQ
jgi:hypothetical protein